MMKDVRSRQVPRRTLISITIVFGFPFALFAILEMRITTNALSYDMFVLPICKRLCLCVSEAHI